MTKKNNDPTKSIKFGSQEHLEWGQVALFEQTKLLKEAHDRILNPKEPKAMVMALSIMSIAETSRSILLLARNSVRDSYALSRIILDAVLNVGLYSVKKENVEKAINHMHQKSFRDFFRNLDLETMKGENTLTKIDDFPVPNKLKRAFEDFTNKKGHEIRNWLGPKRDSVFAKIECIQNSHGEIVGKVLNMATFSIYRHASEIIHGTYFGTCYGIGFTQERNSLPKSDEEYKAYVYQMNSYLMSVLNHLIEVLLRILKDHYNIEDIFEKSNSLTKELNEITTNPNSA